MEYANAAICKLLKFKLNDFIGVDYSGILKNVHEDDRTKVEKMIAGLPEKKMDNCTYRFYEYGSGEIKWLTAYGKYAEDENGPVAYFAYSDITKVQETMLREKRLISCLKLITAEHNWEENSNKVIKYVQEQYNADRAYIFEFDWEKYKMSNRCEYVTDGVEPEIDKLQNMSIDIINYWIPRFNCGEPVFIDDLELIKDDEERMEEYEILHMQNINSLMVVPIGRFNDLYGYIGVDNPASNKHDKEFLCNIAYILSQEYLIRTKQRRLEEFSFTDPLTKLNNRHSFDLRINELNSKRAERMGILFADVNGLKYVNDNFGHIKGDELINDTALLLAKYFSENDIFRVSGDEFVVIERNIIMDEFEKAVEMLRADVINNNEFKFSIGATWKGGFADVMKIVNESEMLMYKDKKLYYEKYPEKLRNYNIYQEN